MEKSFNEIVSQLGEFARGLTLKQKALLIGGALVVLATLLVFVRMMNTPKYKMLYSGMKADEAREIASRLGAKNIAYELSPDGSNISVAEGQLDAARLEAVSEGVPRSGRMGFELFDTPNWVGSDFTEKVNYQRALEGELERTIATLNEVESARVHLVVPGEAIFVQDQREAKAAVMVKLKHQRYSKETLEAIGRLVSSAVDRLRPENVTVIDAETNRPLDASAVGGGPGHSSEVEDQLANKLIRTLEPVVGTGGARASVSIEYEPGTSEEQQETYDPNSSVALTMQKSEERSGDPIAAGVPGTASNVPGSASLGGDAKGAWTIQSATKSENGTYAVNKVLRRTVLPAGRTKRLAVALLVDDALVPGGEGKDVTRRKRTPEEMKQIEEFAKAALGIDASRGDILSVQNLSFEQQPIEKLPPSGKLERIRSFAKENTGALRYVTISLLFLLTYLLVLRPIKKNAVSAFRQLGERAMTRGRLTAKQSAEPINAIPDSIAVGELTPESKRNVAIKKHLIEKVKTEPATASRLVQSWIRQGSAE